MNRQPGNPSILGERLRQAMELRLEQEQVIFLGRRSPPVAYTGRRLLEEADAAADALRTSLGEGNHTLVLALPAGRDFVVTMIACVFSAITFVPVTIPRRGAHSDRFTHVVKDSGASAVICVDADRDVIRDALQADERTANCAVLPLPIDSASRPRAERIGSGECGESPALLQYTSGSTRAPKGVRIMPRNVVENAALMGRSWQLDSRARLVNWLPHFHDMGLMSGILYPLLCGAVSFQMSPQHFIRSPKAWLQAISDHRANFSGGPAFGFAECCRRIDSDDVAELDLSCWTRAFCGAEPVPVGLLDRFYRKFAATGLRQDALFPGYGMAEFALYAAGLPGKPDVDAEEPVYDVQPCRLNDETRNSIRIVDPDTRVPVAEGEIGEIWLRGPSVGSGYHNLPKETAETFGQRLADGGAAEWLRTGDLGAVKGDAFWITGRIKDVIICNGRKIAAPEVEWLACGLDESLNPLAAAAFMPDESESGRAVLIAETRSRNGGPEVDRTEVLRDMRRVVLGEWGLELDEIIIVPRGTLARTSSGKIQRRATAEQYRKGEFRGHQTVPTPIGK